MPETLFIYTPKLSPRIRYSIKTMMHTFLLLEEYEISSSLEDYIQHNGAKFSYAEKRNESGIHFHSSGLLEQKGINELEIAVGKYKDTATLFNHGEDKSALPYDPFAALFFMLSRYEEYLPHLKDKYDRFSSKDSFAHRYGFLETAVVDRWAMHVKDILKENFPKLKFQERKFSYIPTIDVDNAYAYKYKGLLRITGSLFRSLLKFKFDDFMDQFRVLLGQKKDPFDTYNYQLNMQKK